MTVPRPEWAKVGAFFDTEAAHYDAAYDDPGPRGHTLRARLEATLRLVGDPPGFVLDVGMGPGRLLAELQARGWTVAGVDTSSAMAARARQRLPAARDRLLEAPAEALPFGDDAFDVVVATGVIEYLGDRAPALAELARVLRPSGVLVASLPNVQSFLVLWERCVYYPTVRLAKRLRRGGRPAPYRRKRAPDRERFVHQLEAAGFRLEKVEQVGHRPLPRPLDAVFPQVAVRLAELVERRAPRLRIFASQLVFAARKVESA